MIEIKNLTKIYNNSKTPVKALNNVSLVLPDNGLIFVLGKSGSGKSTLLNMLGGLDNITSGDVLFNGMSLKNLSSYELDSYRNDYVGIIYQNFNLFPNETVKSNILASSVISSKNVDKDEVGNICKRLDLDDKENSLVKNLSGGQKQRVAIGRAIIKNPEIVLADEPTGNLDSRTTKTIFNILKTISKDKLVIVISHDTKSALEYADRIIRLSDGKIISDEIRNLEYKELPNNTLVLPEGASLKEEEIFKINRYLKKHNINIGKKEKEFIDFNDNIVSEKVKPEFRKNKGTWILGWKVSNSFLKSVMASFIVTLIILTFIIGVLSLSQSFAQFDGLGAVAQIADDFGNKNFVINKAYSYYNDPKDLNKDYMITVSDEDIGKFDEIGYTGSIYKVYSSPTIVSVFDISNEQGYSNKNKYDGIYSKSGFGTVVCDYDYLEYLFGDIEVVAGSLYNLENTSNLIVTDYFADSLLHMDIKEGRNLFVSEDPRDPYQKITNTNIYNRYTIGAIIDTGYKERYEKLFKNLNRIYIEPQNAKEVRDEIRNSQIFTQFMDELNSCLNFTYSVNKNFQDCYIEENSTAMWIRNCSIIYDLNEDPVAYSQNRYFERRDDLEPNTIIMNTNVYNELFDLSIVDEKDENFEEKMITITNHDLNQDSRDIPSTMLQLKIVGVTNANTDQSFLGYLDKDSYYKISLDSLIVYSLIFDGVDQTYIINNVAKENFFYTNLVTFDAVFQICDIIDIFAYVFGFILIALIIISLIIIISHNLRTVRKNQYRIGVYKSMGCPSRVFTLACFISTTFLVLLTSITSILFVLITNKLLNNILVVNFGKFVNQKVIRDFVFVDFSLVNIGIYILATLIISIASMLAPILYLRKLKPNLILNKAE